jgi:DNA-binding response OmpR family regulator/anti-anti-sigma regulatory factor
MRVSARFTSAATASRSQRAAYALLAVAVVIATATATARCIRLLVPSMKNLPALSSARPPSSSASFVKPVVLIADDDPHSIEVLYATLSEEPIELTVVNDGDGAIEAARRGAPDLILLDVMMEGMNGFDICRVLKADTATRDTPVIFMTSVNEMSARVQAFRLGGVDYITKPFEPEELLARVRTHLSLRSMTKTLAEKNARLERQLGELLAAEAAHEQLNHKLVLRTDELREANLRLEHELKERERAESARTALQDELLRAQQQRLRELSTPLIPITDRVVVMPLIGTVDVERAQHMMESALRGASARRAAFVILDVTGIKDLDARVASLLVQTGEALSLLGAQVAITGIQPDAARILVELGVSLGSVVTLGTLQDGVAFALRGSGGGSEAAARPRPLEPFLTPPRDDRDERRRPLAERERRARLP